MLSAIHEENKNEICTWLGLKWLQKLLKRVLSSKIMFWLFLPQLRELVELTCAFFTSMPGRLYVQRAQSFNKQSRNTWWTLEPGPKKVPRRKFMIEAQRCRELGDRAGEGQAYCAVDNAFFSLGQYNFAIEFQLGHCVR
jgi:hypothetical protein